MKAPSVKPIRCAYPDQRRSRSYPPLSTSGRNTSRSRTFLRQSPRNSSPRNTCSMRFLRALDSA